MKVVICNFPPMLEWYLPSAPAILMGACKWLNIEADFIDFNIHKNKNFQEWASMIAEKNPDIVTLSIFSYLGRAFAEYLAKELKETIPGVILVAGGSGIKDSINGKILIEKKFIDHCIEGDGEVSWPTFLINHFNIKKNIDFDVLSTPYTASYDGYDIKFYIQSAANNPRHYSKLWVPVTGSRGCVRKCTFCEIHEHWKFMQRNPSLIVEEISAVLDKFPAAHIHFTDSLINGSLPSFNKLIELLKPIKQSYPEFSWGGQFIVRNEKQCKDEYWKKIADSGGSLFEIGVETGSDTLRAEMKKNFTNRDLKNTIEYMEKYKIKCVFLLLVGYPTETEDDFNQTIKMLEAYQPYANKVIESIQAGWTAQIHPGTPLYSSSKNDNKMIMFDGNSHVWFNLNNPTLTSQERLRRRKLLSNIAIDLGYKMSFDEHISLASVETDLVKYKKIFSLIENVNR